MKDMPWEVVQQAFKSEPIVSQRLSETLDIYVERYLCQPTSYEIKALPIPAIVTQFGGSKVAEGGLNEVRTDFFPSYSAVIPQNCATQWKFSGFVDFAVFYFPSLTTDPFCQLIAQLSKGFKDPISINDPLIASSALQITQELFQTQTSTEFVNRLMLVLLEQSCKIMSGDLSAELRPCYGQLARIQKTISYIQKNLHQSLTIDELAQQQGLSATHFRRLFLQSTGTSIHKFVSQLRLKKVRERLIHSEMPLVQIAESLGFNSQSHLTTCFKQSHATTPAKYRQLFKNKKSEFI